MPLRVLADACEWLCNPANHHVGFCMKDAHARLTAYKVSMWGQV